MTLFRSMPRLRLGLAVVPLMVLTACVEEGEFRFGSRNADADGPAPIGATQLVERDVEAPEIFEVTDEGLWDGRPSLGGVWVAHPDVTDPERVMIRNTENDRFVIGALFRRERNNPGPSLQISSDAAASLGVLAGDPTVINVVALRREEVAEVSEEPLAGEALGLDAEAIAPVATTAAAAGGITATPLDQPAEATAAMSADTIAAAAAAIDAAEASASPAPAVAPAPQPTAARTLASDLDLPYIQIGIFSVQENANNTGQALRSVGLEPTIYDQTSNGRQFWRVVVGPADTEETRSAILENVRGLGFDDAYFVRR